jgi:RNA polymerase sigma-70 factor, ECF subfamily
VTMSSAQNGDQAEPALAACTAEELAVRAQSGGKAAVDAYSELVTRFHPRVYNFLLRRLAPADAEDLTQEAFIRAWQRIETYNPRFRFSTWLFTIAQRLAISHSRSDPARRERELGIHSEGRHEPVDSLARREQQVRIWGLVEKILAPEQQTAIWLRYVEGLAIGDIAGVLGRTQVSVRVMLFRARAVLAQRLEQTDDGISEVEAEVRNEVGPRKLRPVQCTGGAA